MKKLLVFASVTVVFGLLLSGCVLNTNPPDYMKDVVAYKEGEDGIVIYFILADAGGQMTTARGQVSVHVYDKESRYSYETRESVDPNYRLFYKSFSITNSDFQKTKVGQGAFERDVILCSIGRLPYSSFTRRLSGSTGEIAVEFKDSSGKIFVGKDTILW